VVEPVPAIADPALTSAEIYALYFHGPAYQVTGSAGRAESGPGSVGRLADDLPANHQPPDVGLRIAPRLVELCFQTAGLWQAGHEGVLALPTSVGRLELLGTPTEQPATATAVAGPDGASCSVVADDGTVLLRLSGYGTTAMPGGLPDDIAAPLAAIFGDPASSTDAEE
jgi:hypothetical protein